MNIHDNFLPEKDFKDLTNIVTSTMFPWYLNHGVSFQDDGLVQFTHTIYKNDSFISSYTLGGLDIFKNLLQMTSLVRVKFNLLHRTDKRIVHLPHTDLKDPIDSLKTAILYLNTNNGYTEFETGEKVESVKNRLVVFDAKIKHNGTTNTCDTPYRIVLNLNYF